jgi:hypothetical protein
MTLYETLCKICAHRHKGKLACDAYPERIPQEIRLMYVDHRQPYKGDHGIRFEPQDDSDQTKKRLAKVHLRKPELPLLDELCDSQRERLKVQVGGKVDLSGQPLSLRLLWARKYLAPLVRARGKEFEKEMAQAIRFEDNISLIPEKFRMLIEEAERQKIAAEGPPVAGQNFPVPREEGLGDSGPPIQQQA